MTTWTKADAQRIGVSHRHYFESHLRTAAKAKTDADQKRRAALSECRFCFYFRHSIVGQAFTPWRCRSYDEEHMHHNTGVPVLCNVCAEELGACVRCGGLREWSAA